MILIDGNNLSMASYAVNRQLVTKDGLRAGGLYGILWNLKAMIDRTGGDTELHVAWDAQPSWRVHLLNSYKECRKEKSPEAAKFAVEFGEQRKLIQETIGLLGVTQVRAVGFEADDIAGDYARRFPELTLSSNDGDWRQLVCPGIRIWVPSKKDFITYDNFTDITGCINPEEYVLVKAITGDAGDDVPGVSGVGEKTALKYLRGELNPSTAKFKAIKEWHSDPEGFDRSFRLVNLIGTVIPEDIYESKTYVGTPETMKSKFREVCEKYEFNSILRDFDNWFSKFNVG